MRCERCGGAGRSANAYAYFSAFVVLSFQPHSTSSKINSNSNHRSRLNQLRPASPPHTAARPAWQLRSSRAAPQPPSRLSHRCRPTSGSPAARGKCPLASGSEARAITANEKLSYSDWRSRQGRRAAVLQNSRERVANQYSDEQLPMV